MASCQHRCPWTCGCGSCARLSAAGSPAPALAGGHRRPLLAPHEAERRRLVTGTPDITLVELRAELERRLGRAVGLSTIHNTLCRIGVRHKKEPPSRIGPTSRPSGGARGSGNPARFVFLDESGTATNLAWRYGRSPSGPGLIAAVRHGH
jgi:hypothetical protein